MILLLFDTIKTLPNMFIRVDRKSENFAEAF